MARLGEKYYELGRGYEQVSDSYKRPYLLGVDLTNKEKPFVIAQGDHHSDSVAIQLDIKELLSDKWIEILQKANCSEFRQALEIESQGGTVYPSKLFDEINIDIQRSLELNGNWISTEIIEVLDYNSNFSNWIDAEATPGFFKFQLNLKDGFKNCHLKIPTIDISGRDGHYSIYYGKFQVKNNKILIWQNDTTPVEIDFSLTDDILQMNLFDRMINFKKK
jgi:hypothetical protein